MDNDSTLDKFRNVSERPPAILFYDGDCGLCNRSVRFFMEQDEKKWLRYAPIQGSTAIEYLSDEHRENLSTVIYYRPLADGQSETLLRSDAALYATIDIRSGWRWLAKLTLWIPRSWRNVLYDWVARNRHRFFKKESCVLPKADELQRILP